MSLPRKIIRTKILTGRTQEYESLADVESYGFGRTSVSKCLRGVKDSYKGYKWEYKEERRESS